MNYKELFITIGFMVLLTILYFLIKKFIFWAIDSDNKLLKKTGSMGFKKEDYKAYAEMPLFYLRCSYALFMVLSFIYIISLF